MALGYLTRRHHLPDALNRSARELASVWRGEKSEVWHTYVKKRPARHWPAPTGCKWGVNGGCSFLFLGIPSSFAWGDSMLKGFGG